MTKGNISALMQSPVHLGRNALHPDFGLSACWDLHEIRKMQGRAFLRHLRARPHSGLLLECWWRYHDEPNTSQSGKLHDLLPRHARRYIAEPLADPPTFGPRRRVLRSLFACRSLVVRAPDTTLAAFTIVRTRTQGALTNLDLRGFHRPCRKDALPTIRFDELIRCRELVPNDQHPIRYSQQLLGCGDRKVLDTPRSI